MKILANVATAAFMMLVFHSCKKVVGEGPVVIQNRSTSDFTSISSSISGHVYVKQDNVYKVEIQAQQNIQDVILANVVNGELVIKFRDGVNVKSHENITVNISAPDIRGLRLNGSANLTVLGPLSTEDLNLGISGSGNMVMPELNAANVQADIGGSGNISVLAGKAAAETLRISGSGNIDMLNVQANDVSTTTSGSGSTKVKAMQRLQVKISGSGSVFYRGNPVITLNVSGSGGVVHVN